MSEPWYATYFDENYLRDFTTDLTQELTTSEVDFIEEALDLPSGASILDLACGHGRHAIELARRGYRVTGLDLSRPSLAKAEADAQAANVTARWVYSDMRQVPFEGEFDACINWFTAFGYLESDAEDQKVLAAIHRALKPGGKLLMDTINHAHLMRNYNPRGWAVTPDGGVILEDRKFNAVLGRNEVTVTHITASGKSRVTRHSVRIYTLVEMIKMLEAERFTTLQVWGEKDCSSYSLTSRRMILLCQK